MSKKAVFTNAGIEYSVVREGSGFVVQAMKLSNKGKTILGRYYDEDGANNHLQILKNSHSTKSYKSLNTGSDV